MNIRTMHFENNLRKPNLVLPVKSELAHFSQTLYPKKMLKLLTLITGVLFLSVACQESAETQPEPIPQFDISKSDNGFYAGSGFVVVDYSENADNIEWDFGMGR